MTKKVFLILAFCICQIAFAQEKPAKKDSLRGYRKIEKYAKKRGFTKFIHKLIFKPVDSKKPKNKPQDKVELQNYAAYEGKIIRNIYITTLDPFGFSEKDTTRKPRNWGERLGNRIHLKTKEFTIRNLLLFKKNTPLDSLIVRESERLVRSQRYIRSVDINPKISPTSSDSVDIYIRALDSWSLIPNASGSTSRTKIELTERNFLGLGHEWDNSYMQRFNNGRNAYSTEYTIPNISNTYIETSLAYRIDEHRNYSKSVSVNRPFFSPFAKWGAGIYAAQDFRLDSLPDFEGTINNHNFKVNTLDVWAGKSLQVFKGSSEEDRTTNFIASIRFLRRNYTEKPFFDFDNEGFFANENFYLAGFGLTSRKFIQDKFIFNYGITEDIPIGKIYAITAGYQQKNDINRLYIGGRFAFGQYFKWGYFSTNVEYGTYFRGAINQQSALNIEANYFTNLLNLGEWRLRQFIKPSLVIGTNRFNTFADRININEQNGIIGINSYSLRGTKKAMLALQTQSYSPWSLGGFRFNPFLGYTIAMINGNNNNLLKGKAYSKISVGLIIANDFLVFNQFQLSFSYYPVLAPEGSSSFQTNSYRTTDFRIPGYEFGKPEVVRYQ
ncbi:hypothetical protein GV828_03800 [Flavobacterium sp. NST-5]|uniref:Outer membrane protein/protective antigen OMA87 n=1 Tax=Flavobacterium ichthyis TaxID=2698827 RepID=A0ABW9Z949_9FLAO|nr:hypothetical protein [Flavobacterium ichthyis]NBL64324.1 hypothetical protein [Flavobacterium ichthyis]